MKTHISQPEVESMATYQHNSLNAPASEINLPQNNKKNNEALLANS